MRCFSVFVVSIVVLLSLFVQSSAYAASCSYRAFKINVSSSLNVRSGPGTGYSKIGSVYNGQIYIRAGKDYGSWRKIWYDHRAGWVHKNYVHTPPNITCKSVTAANLNIRSGAGYYSVVGTAKHGSLWHIAGYSGAWRKIYYRGAARWAHNSYLREPYEYHNMGFWNGSTVKAQNNCYAYATNAAYNYNRFNSVDTNKFAHPGVGSGRPKPNSSEVGSCYEMKKRSRGDGLTSERTNIDSPPTCSSPKWRVALYTGYKPNSSSIKDYHWYRYHDERYYWSGKAGPTSATNRDASGNVIYSLKHANHNYSNSSTGSGFVYSFCAYYCADPTNMNIR